MSKIVKVGNIKVGNNKNLVLIAGPCVIESEKLTLSVAEVIKKITDELNLPFIFKSSYYKGNRTAIKNYRGPGLKKGLKILAKVKREFDIPVLSDVQCREEVNLLAEVLDCIQIPAYLCQQTELTLAVAKTGKAVNIKKGQFLAPYDIERIVAKVESTGNKNIILTERGTVFGYNNLVVDMRSFSIMKETGYPVVFDVTHAIRIPGISSKQKKGGQPQFINSLARAGVAAGADALFIETHPTPENALCDATSMLQIKNLKELLIKTKEIFEIVHERKQ